MTRARATVEGYLWNHAGKILEHLLLFLISVLIARGLGVEANGIYAALVSFAQLLVVISSLSLESSLNRYIPQIQATNGQAAGARLRFMLIRVFLLRGLLLVSAVGLTFLITQIPGIILPETIARYFWLLAGYAVVRSFTQLLSMVYVAQLRTAPLVRIAVGIRIVELAGLAGIMGAGLTVSSLMLFLIATGALQVGTCLYVGRSDFSGDVQPHSLRPVFAFGAIYWTNTILDYFLGRQGDVLFLTTLLPSPVPASTYNVAFTIVLVAAQGLTLGLGGITLTSFSRLAVTSVETMNRFYAFLVRMVSMMVLPSLVFIFFNAGPIISLLFSPEFSSAAILVQGMVVFRVVARLFAGSENADYLLGRGKALSIVQIGIIGATANIVLDLLLIPSYFAFGAVIGSGCANLLVNAVGSMYVRKQAGRPVIQWSYWGVLTASAFVAGMMSTYILSGNGWLLLAGRAAMFGGLTILSLYILKPFPAFDVQWIVQVSQPAARLFSRFTRQQSDTVLQVS